MISILLVEDELDVVNFVKKGLSEEQFIVSVALNGIDGLKMVAENITPASKEEFIRWREKPTFEELTSIPDIKYLTFLHVNLRPLIIDYWDKIKQLK